MIIQVEAASFGVTDFESIQSLGFNVGLFQYFDILQIFICCVKANISEVDVLNENYIFDGAVVWRQIYSWLLEKNIFIDAV